MINQNNTNDPVSLKNKVVVVAGGSSKTGKAIAEKLAQTGASIVIPDVHLINAEIVVQHLMEKYKTAAAAVGPNIDEIRSVVATLKESEEIDLWVNAGLLNKDQRDLFESNNEIAGMIINIIPVNDLDQTNSLIIKNNSYGSNFRVDCNINCFRVSAHGRVDGAEFGQKVLALVLDILAVAIL
jgi:NAD(P)-dependent dehydrogenase (short-subunit alcohol dehydrogenase family)